MDWRLLWNCKRLITERFLAAIGILLGALELIKLFVDVPCEYIWGIATLVISIIWGLWILRKTESATLKLNKATDIHIKYDDLFKTDGIKVIPVNEYFDTHVGDRIISPDSLHGQFIRRYFNGREDELSDKIKEQLKRHNPYDRKRGRNLKLQLPENKYELGTSIRISDGDNSFILVVLTRFNEYEHVEVREEEYIPIVQKMFYYIEQLNDNMPVCVPLVGSGQSGFNMSHMQLLNSMLLAAHNSSRLALNKGLHIILHRATQWENINLNVIKHIYKTWSTI